MTGTGAGRWQAPLALLLGLALAALPGTVFNLLQPLHMQRLALPVMMIALLQPPYGVGLLLGALPAASLAGRLGPRRAFLGAVVLVAALSLAAALPLELWALMGLRLVQGMASAGLLAAGLALVRPVFGGTRLAPGFGLAVAAGVLGLVLLPILSGLGMGALGFPGLALPGVVLALTSLRLGLKALPEDPARHPFDALGTLLNLLCLSVLLAALYTAPFRPWRGLVLLVVGVLLAALWAWQARRAAALLPLNLLARPGAGAAAGAALLGGLAVTAVNTAAIPQLMSAWSLPPVWLQFPLLAAALGAALGALAGGWGVARRPAPVGALLLALGAAALVVPVAGAPAALASMLVVGLGRGLFEAGNALALVGSAPAGRGAAAAGLLIAAGALGGLLAPFVSLLLPLFWLGATGQGGPVGSMSLGLGLAAVAALLAAPLSAGGPSPEAMGAAEVQPSRRGGADPAEEMTERVLEAPDGARRVRVVGRDGLYALRVEEFFETFHEGQPLARGWLALPEEASYFVDAETAEREARVRYPWLER
ncbi:MFS transporter [Roseomonas populi]|uniref:MFS transporter n=1 Tax=Roseomonas populi TaxID=3121582 RepID=A0ABT1XCD2_9PROT|nr:MFS transporter [Roseomonas pecuniae]MCR0985068.1 MFS transporter [Roseomonas pecuniae]